MVANDVVGVTVVMVATVEVDGAGGVMATKAAAEYVTVVAVVPAAAVVVVEGWVVRWQR